MLIVDGQIHLWEKGTPSPQHRQEPYSAEQAIAAMDEAGVDRALVHPVLWDPDSNELAIAAVRKYPGRFAIMGWFYLDDPKGPDLVAHWKDQPGKERPGMLGLRFYFNERHKREWMTDGTLDWLWPAAERAGVPVALAAALFLPTVGRIAERYPGLKLIVDHMAVPPGSQGEAAYRFQPELLALAKYPNVAVKATGQPGYAEDAYPFRSFHEHLHRVFDAFGPDRMFWGTDITRMPCSWRQCVTVFTEELPWLQGRDLELVMGEALCNWVGWRLPG
jgi:predicted TIM-barrel fold metal-dependent hydrolase